MGKGLKTTTAQFAVLTTASGHTKLIGDRVQLLLANGDFIELIANPDHEGCVHVRLNGNAGVRYKLLVHPQSDNSCVLMAGVSFPAITQHDASYLARRAKMERLNRKPFRERRIKPIALKLNTRKKP